MYTSKIEQPQRLEFVLVSPNIYKTKNGRYMIERYPANQYRTERFIARGLKGKFLGMRNNKYDAVVLCEIEAGYL